MRSPLMNLTFGAVAVLAAPLLALKAYMVRRQVVGHLAGFDDHLLRDIGLTRGDIDAVLGDSFRDDPTLRLALMVQEARAGRAAMAREQIAFARFEGEAEGHGAAEPGRRAA